MTDTTTAAPRAGWYADPSAAAAYRWWDGAQWTAQTLDSAPTASAPTPAPASTPASAEVEEHAAAEQAAAEQAAAEHAAAEQVAAEQVAAQRHAAQLHAAAELAAAQQRATTEPRPQSPALPSRRSLRNLRSIPASTPPVGPVAPSVVAPVASTSPYVPLNPLSAAVTPPASPSDGWHTPAAWIANAPAAPEYAVYGTGTPFSASRPGAFAIQPRNKAARLALTFMLLVIVLDGITIGVSGFGLLTTPVALLAVAGIALVVVGFVIAAVPLSIVGLVRASQMKASGLKAVGRPHAVVALILSLLFLALFGFAFMTGVVAGFERATSHGTTSISTGAGTGTPAIARSASGAPTPVIGTPQADGTLVYSQSQAQAALATAIKGDTSIEATVGCPTTVALSVGASFECRVTLPGGTATAHVSVLDATGRSEIQISTP